MSSPDNNRNRQVRNLVLSLIASDLTLYSTHLSLPMGLPIRTALQGLEEAMVTMSMAQVSMLTECHQRLAITITPAPLPPPP
jgi:hypothetical protein